jgi:Cu(I)/Ag(I) efflux system membrane fusion protein
MHPQIKQEEPGQCPICGMDLIPLVAGSASGAMVDPDEISMTESAAKLADIQTITVSKGTPLKTLYLQGKVEADERNMAELTARFGGRIEQLYVNFTGQQVKKGDPLATLYSPDLITAQKELLEALSFRESRPSFYTAARAKLKLWDLSDEQIAAIEEAGEIQTYFKVLSPISGTVTLRHVSLGDYVREGTALFEVTDLGRVWVMLDAYESDLPWIHRGDHVDITIPSIPGKAFAGRIAYIDPIIRPETRTAQVRIELPNPGLTLKPEMFVQAVVHSEIAGSADQLLIPKSSVLWTGKRAVVYVKVPDRESPTFIYHEITLGPEAGEFYVVASGLAEGETIATNGVFKIDAAAQLAGRTSMMNPEGSGMTPVHNHGSMSKTAEPDHSGPRGEAAETAPAGPQIEAAESKGSEINTAFKDQIQKVYDAYILMTDAFVATNSGEVSEGARKVGAALQQVDMELLSGEAHMEWMKELEVLKRTILQIASSNDISEQRLVFAEFNNTFYQTLHSFGLERGTIYYQYCPMANGDEGAYWFSNQKEIANPYFGNEMLQCGETRETLEFNE